LKLLNLIKISKSNNNLRTASQFLVHRSFWQWARDWVLYALYAQELPSVPKEIGSREVSLLLWSRASKVAAINDVIFPILLLSPKNIRTPSPKKIPPALYISKFGWTKGGIFKRCLGSKTLGMNVRDYVNWGSNVGSHCVRIPISLRENYFWDLITFLTRLSWDVVQKRHLLT
jgi:hypothetical protein